MNGPQSIWAAGTDTLLQTLAQREAAQQLAAEKARRAQLDAEERAERQRSYDLQRRQLESTLAGRTAETEANKRREADIELYRAAPPEERPALAEMLALRHGIQIGKPALEEVTTIDEEGNEVTQFVTPKAGDKYRKPAPKPSAVGGSWQTRTGANGKPERFFAPNPTPGGPLPPSFTPYERPREGPAPDKPDKPLRADLLLPVETKTWIGKIAGQGLPYQDTVNLIQQGWEAQREGHPEADLKAAIDYVESFYQKDPLGVPQPMLKPPPAAAAPGGGGTTPASSAAFGAAFGPRAPAGVKPPGTVVGPAPAGVGGLVLPPGLGGGPAARPAAPRPAARPVPPEVVAVAVEDFFQRNPTVPRTPANLAAAQKKFGG